MSAKRAPQPERLIVVTVGYQQFAVPAEFLPILPQVRPIRREYNSATKDVDTFFSDDEIEVRVVSSDSILPSKPTAPSPTASSDPTPDPMIVAAHAEPVPAPDVREFVHEYRDADAAKREAAEEARS